MSLSEIFPDNFNYLCEKLPEYAGSADAADYGKGMIRAEQVAECLTALRAKLTPDRNRFLFPQTERALYALKRLKSFFADSECSSLTAGDAYVFGAYLEVEAKKIRDIAVEIDNPEE